MWKMTHLKTGFGGVRLGGFRVGVALSARLATGFSYDHYQLCLSTSNRGSGNARVPLPPGMVTDYFSVSLRVKTLVIEVRDRGSAMCFTIGVLVRMRWGVKSGRGWLEGSPCWYVVVARPAKTD